MSDDLTPILLSVLLAAGILCLMFGLFLHVEPRLAAGRGGLKAQLRRSQSEGKWLFGRLLESGSESSREAIRKTLIQAGFDHPSAPLFLSVSRILSSIILAALSASVLMQEVIPVDVSPRSQKMIFVLMAIIGYVLPGLAVKKAAEQYVDRIAKALPDALDLMLVCVEAGQSLDQALVRVSRSLYGIHPELAERFSATAEAIKAGEDRRGAFDKMAYMTDNADLKAFAAVVLQSAGMGTPVSEVFRVYSADQRDRRIRKIEEKANILPTKLTLGTMMLTVPPLLLLLLTPAVYSILQSF